MHTQSLSLRLAACIALVISAPAQATCFASDSTPAVIGIEVQDGCAYALVKYVQTPPFLHRHQPLRRRPLPVLALDPAHTMYKPFLTLAATSLQPGQRDYANVQSRISVVSTLSIVTEASNL